MKNTFFALYTVLFFSLFITLTSCNGQTQTIISTDISNNQKTTIAGQPKINLPEGVSPQTMFRCSMKDKEGNLWFGTTGAGIYRYDGKLFTRYAEKEGLASNFVVGIAQDIEGNIWVATNNGIFHSNGNSFSRLEIPEIESPKVGIGTYNSSIKKIQVFCVVGDKKGNIWFGTESDGLWKYDGTKLTNYKCADSNWIEMPKNNSLNYKQKGFVSAILEDKKGNIWFSSMANGLNCYNGTSFKTVNSIHSNHHTLQMIEDASGNIWMATRLDGICRYNGKTIESYIEKDGVYDNMASSLYQAKNGNILFGSLGKAGTNGNGLKGITVYDGKTFTPIASTGLRNNQVWTVVEDNEENVWVGTKEFGLFRYDGKIFTEFTSLQKEY
jgi:ligand-binding sensor domain-containing protein